MPTPRFHGFRVRAAVVVLVLAVGLAGAFGTGTVLLAVPAHAGGLQTTASFDDYDRAKVAELVGEGFSEAEAIFLALSTVEGKATGDRRVRLTESFPTGNQAVINVNVIPAASGGSADTPLKAQSRTVGGDLRFSLEYFVSSGSIPVDVRKTIGVALAGGAASPVVSASYASAPALPASVSADAEVSTYQILVKGLVTKLVGDKASEFVKYLDKTLDSDAKATTLLKSLKAGLAVKDALVMGSEFDQLMQELDALEKCATNPTNPLTKKEYTSDPSERDRILKEIAGVRAELQGNFVAMFIGTLNKNAAGLIKSAPWLGYVVGPGTSWAIANFKQVAQDRMNEIRKGVVACVVGYKLDQASPEGSSLKGTKCDGPHGEWVFQGLLDSGGIHSEAVYTITIGKDSLDGTYQWSNTTVIAGAVVAVNARGHASVAPEKDGSVVMKLDASSSSSTAVGDGGEQAVAVPFPAQSFTWKVAAGLCDQPT